MSSIPTNAPASCPGPNTADAGKAHPCQGCPNQGACASGKGVADNSEIRRAIQRRLRRFKYRLLVLSGKGGVGKSSVTACLARFLSGGVGDKNRFVGILDVDICGPSQPTMFACEREEVHSSGQGWSPVFVCDSLCLMSIGFMLPGPDEAVIWRGPKKNQLIKEMLLKVDWFGDADEDDFDDDGDDDVSGGDDQDDAENFLLIDTPPGTSDEHLSIVEYLKEHSSVIPASAKSTKPSAKSKTAAIIVTSPQEVALQDIRKEIDFCRKVNLPILGIVENMSGFACPNCGLESEIFPPDSGGAAKLCEEENLPLLAQLPLMSKIAQTLDHGENPFDDSNGEVKDSEKDEPNVTKQSSEQSRKLNALYDILIGRILLEFDKI